MPSEQRAAYVKQACREDTPLREQVEILLKAHAAAGNFLEAIKTYMRVLRLTPDSIETRNDLGMAYFNIGGYTEAAKAFNQALQIQESNVRAHFGLGLVYVDLRRRELAMTEHTTLQDMGEEKMALLLMDHINREFY